MCGFVAIAGEDAAAPGRVEAGVQAIRHRGPDGQGTWRSKDARVALGHARLAIIDLSSAGAQPMHSADGLGAITFNGEIYNYRELKREVRRPLKTGSDTEVLVELLRERGVAALSELRGMFAFAYWDGEELLLARDRLGIKPLFYAESGGAGAGGRIHAASELAALLAMGAVDGTPDLRAIDDYLTYLYVPPPRTGIAGCKELPPGHLLRWRPGRGATVERYWSPPAEAPARAPSAEEVRHIIDDAVRAHLVADVPVGVFLSGGLDSSSIVALAAKHYAGTLKTFTVTFDGEGSYLDERGFAKQIATRFGTEHTEINARADVAEILPALVTHFGQPFGNPTAVLTYALSRATRAYVKVALAGDGGDEVLGGYPRYQGVWAAELYRKIPAPAKALLEGVLDRAIPQANARGRLGDRWRRFRTSAELAPDAMYYRWVTYLDGERKRALWNDRDAALAGDAPTSEYEFLAGLRSRYAERSMRDAAPLVDLGSFLPHNVLNYGDRMSMAHALEVRVPFCDHALVERLAPLPLSRKMPRGVQKGLFRWAMRRDLPTGVITHRKVGFNPPIAAWLRKDLAGLAEGYLGERAVKARGLFRPSAVAALREEFARGSGEVGIRCGR